MGRELRKRGHAVALGSHAEWRSAAAEASLDFIELGPDLEALGGSEAVLRRASATRDGKAWWLQNALLTMLPAMTNQTIAMLDNFDAVVSHPWAHHAKIAAQVTSKDWINTILEPAMFFSEFDRAVSFAPLSEALSLFGNVTPNYLRNQIRKSVEPLNQRILEVGRSFGVDKWDGEPLFEGQFSPQMNLALMSRVFVEPRADWPSNTIVTGFPYHDTLPTEEDETTMEWIGGGSKPIVFALGDLGNRESSELTVNFREAIQAAGLRGLIVGSPLVGDRSLEGSIREVRRADLRDVLPQSQVLVHGGSVGMVAQAMRSGIPSISLPASEYEEDHAQRLVHEGCGTMIARARASSEKLIEGFKQVRQNPEILEYAELIKQHIQYESGAVVAADAVECLAIGKEIEKRLPVSQERVSRSEIQALWQSSLGKRAA